MAAMYLQPGGDMGSQKKTVSLEDVAEEVLNGLFCHYEPPTSEEYQRRVAEEIRKNNGYPNNKSILRPTGRGGGYRDYSKPKTVTWRDEQRRVEDHPDAEFLHNAPPTSCLGTGWEILNAKVTDYDPRAPQPPKKSTEAGQSDMPPVPDNGVAGDYQQRKRAGGDMMDQYEDRKSPRAYNQSPKNGKGGPILYDDEGYPVVEDDEDEDDGIVDENIPPRGFLSGPPPPSPKEVYPSPKNAPPSPALLLPFSCGLSGLA